MAKTIAKITVQCPACSAQQQEPEAVKSTYCRRCSQYIAISSGTIVGAGGAVPKPTTGPSFAKPSETPPPSGGFKDKIDGWLGKPRQRSIHCFECKAPQDVLSSAQSSTCRFCGAYIDLQDYKVSGSFSRNIVTHGAVHVGSKGDLSSSRIACESATIHGKLRGNLSCSGKVMVRAQGRITGTLQANHLIIEKGSDLVITRPVRVSLAEIGGKIVGQIISDSHVTILKSGYLEGNVTAKGFSVEKGGVFQGELTIGPAETAVSPTEAPTSADARPAVKSADPILGAAPSPAT